MRQSWFGVLLCICIAAAWAFLAASCDDSRDYGDDDDDDGDTESEEDTGTGECSQVAWGGGCSVGNPVGNWSITSGYMDSDLDGVIEEEEVSFTLEEIHCAGVQSLVFVAGDTG
jgi:hypothetical protein